MKRLFAIVIAVAMTFTQAGFVFADDSAPKDDSGETVQVAEETAVEPEVKAEPQAAVEAPAAAAEPVKAEEPAKAEIPNESASKEEAVQEEVPSKEAKQEETSPQLQEEKTSNGEKSSESENQTDEETASEASSKTVSEIAETEKKADTDNAKDAAGTEENNRESALPADINSTGSKDGNDTEDSDADSDNGFVTTMTEAKLSLKSISKTAKMAADFEFDNSTTLSDGTYESDEFEFKFEGGTGKAKLTLDKVVVSNGKATGYFTASSDKMTHVYLGKTPTTDEETSIYDPSTDTMAGGCLKIKSDQTVTFPVKINKTADVSARTTAMSSPHWVNYTYYIEITEPAPFSFDNSTTLADGSYSVDDIEFTFTGGTGKSSMTIESLTVKDGKATATLSASSDNMTHVYLAKTPSTDEDPAIYNASKDRMAPGVYKIVDKKVTVPVKVGTTVDLSARTTAMSVPHWVNYQYTINVKEDAEASFDNSTSVKDGTYSPDDFKFEGGTGKATATCESVTVKDGKAEATFTVSSENMTHVYLNETKSDAEDIKLYDPSSDKTGTDVYPITDKKFTIPVRLNEDVSLAIRTTAMSEPHWVNYTYNITVIESQDDNSDPSDTNDNTGNSGSNTGNTDSGKNTGNNNNSGKDNSTSTDNTKTPTTKQKLEDGTYKVLTTTDRRMFYIYPKEQDPAYSILTVKDGKMTATITLTGEGYDYVFMGTPEEAAKAKKSQWIKAEIVNGYYTFTIPVAKLDKKLAITPHSSKYAADPEMADQAWRPDKWIKFYSGDAVKIKDGTKSTAAGADKKDNSKDKEDEENGATAGTQTEFKNDNKKDKVSKWKDDSSGSTSAVDASTTLKDGVYTPDSFSWSGGSGKLAYIRCNKITVTGGQAYATIEFSSSKYDQLRANGRVYANSGGGNSTFVIPVKLNANNTIIGRTTAMSQAHWVKYTIYIGKAETKEAAEKAQEAKKEAAEAKIKIAEEAPTITGLEYDSTTEVENAEYFRIFNYKDGVKLLSIDITANTELKEEYTKNAEAALKASEDEDGLEYDEEGNLVAKSQNEFIESLYHNNVVNYLLVPEDYEVPAGLDKEYVVVKIPADNTFIGSMEAVSSLDKLGKLDAVSLLGISEDMISELPETLQGLIDDDKTQLAGDMDKPDYAKVVKTKPVLAILPGDLIPEEIKKDSGNKDELKTEAQAKQEQLEKLESRFTALDAPVIIDRSAQEKDELAQAEWIKVYGAIFGCEEEAAAIYDKQVNN